MEVESSPFATVNNFSSTLDCEASEDDCRTPPPRSNWNVNAWLDRLHLFPITRRDDTAVDLENRFDKADEQILSPTSPIEEVAIGEDDIIIACCHGSH